MAYSPELNRDYSGALRRIAWAIDLPMTTTLEEVISRVAGRSTMKPFVRPARTRASVTGVCLPPMPG